MRAKTSIKENLERLEQLWRELTWKQLYPNYCYVGAPEIYDDVVRKKLLPWWKRESLNEFRRIRTKQGIHYVPRIKLLTHKQYVKNKKKNPIEMQYSYTPISKTDVKKIVKAQFNYSQEYGLKKVLPPRKPTEKQLHSKSNNPN